MDCTQAQDLVLDELDDALEPRVQHELRRHLGGCGTCTAFATLQRRLDAELRDSAPTLALDGSFRLALNRRLAVQQPWPEWLPEAAYLLGAVLATGVSAVALPLPFSSTWWIGGALAAAGLLVHSLTASALSSLDSAGVSDLR
jgi:hypothetical protein